MNRDSPANEWQEQIQDEIYEGLNRARLWQPLPWSLNVHSTSFDDSVGYSVMDVVDDLYMEISVSFYTHDREFAVTCKIEDLETQKDVVYFHKEGSKQLEPLLRELSRVLTPYL